MFSDNKAIVCKEKEYQCGIMIYKSKHNWFQRIFFRRFITDMMKIWIFSFDYEELKELARIIKNEPIEFRYDKDNVFFITCETPIVKREFDGFSLSLLCLGNLGNVCYNKIYCDTVMVVKALIEGKSFKVTLSLFENV